MKTPHETERQTPNWEPLETIKTGIPQVDRLLQGGLITGTMNQLFGTRMVGKSILSFQLAYQYTKQHQQSVLYFDTELGFNKSIRPYWQQTFAQQTQQNPVIHTVKTERHALKARNKKAQQKEIRAALQAGLTETTLKYTKQQLDAATQRKLIEWFREDVLHLQQLIDRDVSHWLEVMA